MAAWQADFAIIPAGAWPTDYRERLDAVATRNRSWHADLETWGVEDGNRVDVHLERGAPVDGRLRVDLRRWDPAFIRDVLALMSAAALTLTDEAGARVEPNVGELALALRRSAAFRFVDDPEQLLRRLQRGGLADA